MDRIKETINVLKQINRFNSKEISDDILIKSVCDYFNEIKNDSLNQSDLKFLKYISNIAGIPHYFDTLKTQFNQEIGIEEYNLNTFSSLLYESTLHTNENLKVHKYQMKIMDLFQTGKLNRYFLSASTSFGKTHIVFEIIKKMNYGNVVLIFPTIALLSENLEKLISDNNYEYFTGKYKIHTLSEVTEFEENNLFIYTPERFLSFKEKNPTSIIFNFAFIDEIYKIDNEYLLDEEVKENERDVAYRLSVFYALENNVDVLLAGPYIDFYDSHKTGYNGSFDKFLIHNEIELINYNQYEIVSKTYEDIKSKKHIDVDKYLEFDFETNNKTDRLIEIVKKINEINENTIVYCSTRNYTESYATTLLESDVFNNHSDNDYSDFIKHISKNFSRDWTIVKALQKGIGVHHGLIPKYIQKEIISLFNSGKLKVLISTTTITEGVNTSAKNLIVLHSKKGDKELKKFDAKNIAGRAGRFLYHYSGRVIVLKNDFMKAIESEPEGIKHKNYDLQAPKDEIDLFYSKDEFLSQADQDRKTDIKEEQEKRGIPDEIFNLYKVVSRLDKIILYDEIKKLSASEIESIKTLIRVVNYKMDIDYDGFQVILKVIRPIVKNPKLIFLIDYKGLNGEFSTITHLLHFYLTGGFIGSIKYKISQNVKIDKAISDTAEFVYNTLKYQVVKYLGVFNIMYRFIQAQENAKAFDDIAGIDRLLVKLEYNALTENGQIASDYGVPSSVVEYYENTNKSKDIKSNFDNYEMKIFDRIETIINGTDKSTNA
ncbi:helicase-related protein [Flavobacterium sp. ZE23DGlu08]|uniref:helicase-related protein n=1 Tax=Flavobacterium sp. ZE23DGlu08 TaxID=3059026 RepID=UPI00265F86A8|nr:helicase-related protein [Flavobacterium sp. ZE23DGlu08]WKL43311.1 helicase-related protein [Flavobacterium sp. ZE23DGlu08]